MDAGFYPKRQNTPSSANFPHVVETTDPGGWLPVTGSPVSFEETGAAHGGHTESAFAPEARLQWRQGSALGSVICEHE